MLNVAVAIDFPTESAQAAVQTVSRSCEEALGEGRCPAAADLKPAAVVTWYAVIHSDDPDLSRMRVEFRDRSADGVLIETRTLTFSEHDNIKSRWASAGAVIAAFVATRDGPRGAPSSSHRELETPPEWAGQTPRGPVWGFDLALLAGPGIDPGPYRLGGLLRGFVGIVPRVPGVLGVMSLRYASRPGDLDVTWLSASLGMGARVGGQTSPLSAELTGELAFERMLLSAENPLTGHRDSDAQNRFGGRLGVNFAWAAWPTLSFLVGAEATAMRPALSISVADTKVGREPLASFGLSAGIRFSR
jgi:hypothetical protein